MIDDDRHKRLIQLLRDEVEIAQTGFTSSDEQQFQSNKALLTLISSVRDAITPIDRAQASDEKELTLALRDAKQVLFRTEFPRSPEFAPTNIPDRPPPRTRQQIARTRIAEARARSIVRRRKRQQAQEQDNGIG